MIMMFEICAVPNKVKENVISILGKRIHAHYADCELLVCFQDIFTLWCRNVKRSAVYQILAMPERLRKLKCMTF